MAHSLGLLKLGAGYCTEYRVRIPQCSCGLPQNCEIAYSYSPLRLGKSVRIGAISAAEVGPIWLFVPIQHHFTQTRTSRLVLDEGRLNVDWQVSWWCDMIFTGNSTNLPRCTCHCSFRGADLLFWEHLAGKYYSRLCRHYLAFHQVLLYPLNGAIRTNWRQWIP